MNYSAKAYSVLIFLISAMAAPALAQQPPDPVTSDSMANTAMGSNALLNVNLSESGCHNTASGEDALYSDISGSYNTATGFSSLFSNTTGNNNTAAGYESLYFNSTGSNNTASGYQALYSNTTGSNNAGVGYAALHSNTTGNNNSASGVGSLFSNSTGYNNNAAGFESLHNNTTGYQNNAMGVQALYSNTTADNNNAMGFAALYKNTTGVSNSAVGSQALYHSTTGNFNDAVGYLALFNSTSGSNNVAIGLQAGYYQTTGSDNVYISNDGVAAESGMIRIGTAGTHTATYIAGIENAKVTGSAVYVTSSGQLGVLASSERYKTDITPITTTEKLQQLRPVSFHLKSDPKGAVQYGLIAEEVDKVYPELVIRDEAGKIQGVRYDELAPMLLNEVQKQQQVNSLQAAKIASLEQQLAGIQAALVKLQPKDELVAQR